jgi:riboflavin kinase/FMN adenylyltransferase
LAVYHDIEDIDTKRSVLTVGSFDGVHSGHRVLLQRVVELAHEDQCRSLVVSFWPHPRITLDSDILLLNTLEERIDLLTQTGIDDILLLRFDHALAQVTASDFMDRLIVGKLNAACWVVGKDHNFGKDRQGNANSLSTDVSRKLRVEVIDLKKIKDKISSSSIRQALQVGDLAFANQMLGYPYRISGKVVAGNRLGRTIGFPTANIATEPYKLLPKDGVYRVSGAVGKIDFVGMMYIGKRNVLKEAAPLRHVEIHIFGFDADIYGKTLTVSLTHRIRDDRKFDNLEQLQQQLQCDKQLILSLIS